MELTTGLVSRCVCVLRFGRKLAVIRGEVEREIQALVSKRDNVHTHHPYHAWDPVPSLSAASAGTFTLESFFYLLLLQLARRSFAFTIGFVF